MYLVISKWEANPGQEDRFFEIGRTMRSVIRSWPGVQFVYSIRAEDGTALAIVAYDDQITYENLMNSRFDLLAKEHGIENVAVWQWSERGIALDEAQP